jgi:hypothetical protein
MAVPTWGTRPFRAFLAAIHVIKSILGIYGTVLRNFGKLGRQHLSGFRVVFKEKIGDSPLVVKTYAFCCAESRWKP